MRTALVVVGAAAQVVAGAAMLWFAPRSWRKWSEFQRRPGPLKGLPAREKLRIGRLASSGWVVPSDDAERVRALIERQVRVRDEDIAVPSSLLLLGLGDALIRLGTDEFTVLRAILMIGPGVLLFGAWFYSRGLEAKYDATARANGWDLVQPDEAERAPPTRSGEF